MDRPHRGRAPARYAFLVAALVALTSCGGDVAPDVSGNGAPPTGDQTTNGGADGPDREIQALPGAGPVDPVFPPGTPAYDLLATGRCSELRDAAGAWGPEVVEVEGADTIELYRSAAHACLGEWDVAIEAFGRISGEFEGDCARQAVLAWLRSVIQAREADPQFEPSFVPSGQASQCPAEPAPEEQNGGEDQPADEESPDDVPADDGSPDDVPADDGSPDVES